MATGLFLFQHDLRLHDNTALMLAASEMDHLICVYCLPCERANSYPYRIQTYGQPRMQFLLQSLQDLSEQLAKRNQYLHVLLEHPLNILPTLITQHNIAAVYSSEHPGVYEQRVWQTLQGRYPYLPFKQVATHTLFDRTELPFELADLPETFSKFRRCVEELPINSATAALDVLPPRPHHSHQFDVLTPILNASIKSAFTGGESTALMHLDTYFASPHPSQYKETRNALDGWTTSTKFSPWLATGCISPRLILDKLDAYEQEVEANDSTGWIKFELLWREYFQWYAYRHGTKLFAFRGIKDHGPNTAFYPERFRRWCEGNTPYPLVNALMNELKATGYMSNRGRQIVASCLVNELSVDWRYGAGYFEQHLLDYDTASNWGNWQYLAGVGADPVAQRHFNLQKQTDMFDPKGEFIRKWRGNDHDGNLDSVDAADWPIW